MAKLQNLRLHVQERRVLCLKFVITSHMNPFFCSIYRVLGGSQMVGQWQVLSKRLKIYIFREFSDNLKLQRSIRLQVLERRTSRLSLSESRRWCKNKKPECRILVDEEKMSNLKFEKHFFLVNFFCLTLIHNFNNKTSPVHSLNKQRNKEKSLGSWKRRK